MEKQGRTLEFQISNNKMNMSGGDEISRFCPRLGSEGGVKVDF